MTKSKKTNKVSGKIIGEEGQRLLTVSNAEDLKIITAPQRQRIFKLLQIAGKPLHGKEIADSIGVKAPTAHFHLRKLKAVGAVRVSHTEKINGITATYYEPAVDIIVTGEDFMAATGDEGIDEKLLFAANIFNEAKASFVKSLGDSIRNSSEANGSSCANVLQNAILCLSPKEVKAFNKEIGTLLKKYSKSAPNKQAYSLFLSISEQK